jgi:cell pole-organizing protein PopZ
MSDPPPALDAILASIRARVMEPGNDEDGDMPPPAADKVAAPAVPLANVTLLPGSGGITLEELVRSMLAPQIKAWLDANMPEIVEKLARDEIRRLTGKL